MTLAAAQARLQAHLAQPRVAAGSLIVTVLGDAVLPRGGALWLGSLIQLMGVLGINERLVRTSVFRLAQDHWLRAETQGRRANYHLTDVGRHRFDEAARHIYAAAAPQWDRKWRLLIQVGEFSPRERDTLRRSMRWQGFGEITPGTFLHPSADLAACMEALDTDGLTDLRPRLMPLLSSSGGAPGMASDARMVQQAWDLDALASGYQAFMHAYQPLARELKRRQRSTKAAAPLWAFVARTLLIHDFRRLLLRDPELPADLLPARWPGQQAREQCATLYHVLLEPSEQFLDDTLQLADGTTPAASRQLRQRLLASP